jgi:soluble lytic murein transglycosylase
MRPAILAALLPLLAAAQAPDGPALLKSATTALEAGRHSEALRLLDAARPRLAPIADYVAFFTAQAHYRDRNFQAVVPALAPVFRAPLPSPLAGRAAVLGATALVENGDHARALEVLAQVPRESLPQPQADFVRARAQEGSGDVVAASASYQAVYYGYPLSTEAATAGPALGRLESALGDRYPAPAAEVRLDRAGKILDARQYDRARREYLAIASDVPGLERQQARIRSAATMYRAKRTDAALSGLEDLRSDLPEAEAERLYWLVACLRRLNRDQEVAQAVARQASVAPQSPWRLKTLLDAANDLMLDNDAPGYVPLFRACAQDFPASPEAPSCHWRALWPSWLQGSQQAVPLLEEHLLRYPSSEKAGAALYYLGRAAERAGSQAAAKRWWQELVRRYPNYYYGVMARDLLARPAMRTAADSPDVAKFLARVNWPERPRQADFEVDEVTAKRMERARLLARAGLDTWAEGELRFGARNGAKPFPIAVELAENAIRRGEDALALRYVKGTVNGYLFLDRSGAPQRFWRLAFPFPYRAKIERYCRERGLDPFLVAAIIRQESEFDPRVVSYAGAIGLTQLMPGTGRELARRVGLKRYSTALLKDPDTNLNLGTFYMARQLASRNGSVEQMLAGYNAGPTRVPKWTGWYDYHEPAELSETIPFQQTRDYIQFILRNADVYRWLYASEPVPAEEPAPKTPAKTPARKAAKTHAGKSNR